MRAFAPICLSVRQVAPEITTHVARNTITNQRKGLGAVRSHNVYNSAVARAVNNGSSNREPGSKTPPCRR